MRIDKDTLQNMESKVLLVWSLLKRRYPEIKPAAELTPGMLHDLWFRTWASVNYPDCNPNVLRFDTGERVLQYDPTFELYPCGSDDTTLLTALRRIQKTLE